MTIVAAGSAMVVASMPPPEPTLAHEARILAARLATAADEAVISGLPVGVDIDATGYGFRRRDAADWRPIADDPTLARRAWAPGVTVAVVREGAALDRDRLFDLSLNDDVGAFGGRKTVAPAGRFDPTGSATALTLDLAGPEGAAADVWRVTVGVDGAVALSRSGEG